MTQEKANNAQKANPKGSNRQIQDWLIGRVLGKYKLIRPIGFGSFASIYEAIHIHLRVPFAIKILHPAFTNHEEVVKRFFREGQAASQLQHENVVFIADFDVEEDVGPYIVMEYLEGQTLKEYLAEKKVLSIPEVGEIARQICQALTLAHSKGIIHRDLKPENIFLVPRGGGRLLVKILDFGIAHLADCSESITGAKLLGTPVYMAPEQFRGETHSNSLDIYSFGILLYEMLMGNPPFKGKNVQQLGIEHLLIPAPLLPESFPETLRTIQAKLLAKKPEERPSSMAQVWKELALAIDPKHSFTHWHQEAISPEVAKYYPQQQPTKEKEIPTDTVIESLNEYNFKGGLQSFSKENANTAKERNPEIKLNDEYSPTSKYTPPLVKGTILPSVDLPNEEKQILGSNPSSFASLKKQKTPSDTADESAELSPSRWKPLPPLPSVDTTVTPLNKVEKLTLSEKEPSPAISPNDPISQKSTSSSKKEKKTYLSTRKNTRFSQFFGRMGNKEKQLLLIVWVGVLLVVGSVFSLIFKTLQSTGKREKNILRQENKKPHKQIKFKKQNTTKKRMIKRK